MSNINYKKRTIILSFICAIVIVAMCLTFVALFQSIKEDNSEVQVKHLYATVLETGNNYIKVSDLDNSNSYMFKTKKKYNKGDLVSISYYDNDNDLTTKEIELIAEKDELEVLEETERETTTTILTTSNVTSTSTTKKNINNTTKVVSSKKSTITTKKTTSTTASDNEVIAFVKNEYDNYGNYSNSKSIPEKAKQGFVTIIDFIFYDGTIKGKKFKDLTSSAKAKVIYYALLIDNKIDTKWPDYKNSVKNKFNDLKSKLIAEYMRAITMVCEKNENACKIAREDFNKVKGALNITWSNVKDAAKYGYGKITTILKEWYETWRDK